MNLLQLRQSLALRLGLDTVAADGLVSMVDANLLNSAAREIGTALSIPRASASYNRATLQAGPLTLPTGFVDLVRITGPNTEPIPVVDEDSYVPTSRPWPSLEGARHGGFFVYNRRSPTLRWVGEPGREPPEEVKVIYAADWPPMTLDVHLPWLGQYARWHEIIAARAAITALLSLDPGEPETAARLRYNQADYERLYGALSEEVEPPIFLLSPPLSALMNRRSSWRYG